MSNQSTAHTLAVSFFGHATVRGVIKPPTEADRRAVQSKLAKMGQAKLGYAFMRGKVSAEMLIVQLILGQRTVGGKGK